MQNKSELNPAQVTEIVIQGLKCAWRKHSTDITPAGWARCWQQSFTNEVERDGIKALFYYNDGPYTYAVNIKI